MGEFHALALHTYTPKEWAQVGVAPASPTCAGGGHWAWDSGKLPPL
jgi:BolA protein